MKLETGTVIKGFRVERIRESKELGGRFVEMRHEKVGTTLHWVDNGNPNKLFCVGFKTLPEDSTGVFHILEHSVLCGSKKYPVKEPFVDLIKSSMNTFLNAMTFPDKTIYPVSSRNERDFLNLTEVYLDAVFAPRCVVDPNAFRQEGWRLELAEDGTPYINGVVYNEMKGATSGVDDILEEGMGSLLFPDNCYGENSGGEPSVIPELTYDMYKAMYHKYYHPSNARIFLDGSVPLEATLDLINEYLGDEKQDAVHAIPMQEPRVGEKTVYYEVGAEENTENRTMLSFGRIIGAFDERKKLMMAEVLCSLLADTNDAPLKRAILDAGLGEDVELMLMDGVEQPRLVLTVRNTDAAKKNEIVSACEKVVKGLLEKGIDRELLTAHLNRYAFQMKDMREPAGLIRCIMSYQGSLYGGDPMLYLENDAFIKEMREGIDRGEFEAMLKDMLDFTKMSVLTVLPSKEHGEKLRREESARAKAIYDAMDEAARQELTELNDRLHAWQEAPDRPEDTATIPVLPLSEVSPEPVTVPTEASLKKGMPIIYHALPTNGITHFNLYFSLTDLDLKGLSAAGLMCSLLTKLPTKSHSVSELQKEINTHIGRLRFEVKTSMRSPKACTPYLAVSCDVLDGSLEKAEAIVAEILTETIFDEPAKIKEIVAQLDEGTKQGLIMGGHMVGMTAVGSHYISAFAVRDAVTGWSFRSYIKALSKDIEARSADLITELSELARRAFCKARLTVGLTASEKPCLKPLVEALPDGLPAPNETHYESPLPMKLGIRIPAQVSFAEKGVLMPDTEGSMSVAASIISLGHLWNRVRVQGGAYGVGLRVDRRGLLCHYTYRDPSPARSLDVFGEESDFIKAYVESGEDMTKFIISSIGGSEPLRSPADDGAAADLDYLDGYTYEKQKRFREELLSANSEKLLAFRNTLEACAKDGAVCVVGSEGALKEIEGLTVVDA